MTGFGKSISTVIRGRGSGSSSAKRSPSATATGWRMSSARRTAGWRTRPMRRTSDTNGTALPSMIGTSGPLSSTTALSISQPRSAASRCSTVCTVTPCSLAIVVHSSDSTTLRQCAVTARCPASTSSRRKRIPDPGGAGRRRMRTRCPLCRPRPTQLNSPARECCQDRVCERRFVGMLSSAAGEDGPVLEWTATDTPACPIAPIPCPGPLSGGARRLSGRDRQNRENPCNRRPSPRGPP